MKTSIKFLAIALLSIAATTGLQAQNRRAPQKGYRGGEKGERIEKLSAEEQAKKMTERMTKTLDLSAKQSKELYDINLKYATQKAEKSEAVKREREEKKENMKERADKRAEEIKSILNAEQRETFEKMGKSDRTKKITRGKAKRPII